MYKLMVAIDVSGSISSKQVKNFLTEIFWLMKKHKAQVEFLMFDTEIQKKKILKRLSDIDECKKIYGRGGTSFIEVIKYAKKKHAKDLVIFTDGYGDQNEIKNPGVRLWWIVDNDRTNFPIGKVIRVDSYE
jgi:predicted metal-dependent peptidase